jgi:transportin-1
MIIRSAAAVMLKNSIKTGFRKISETSLTLIRSSISNNLKDSNSQIRNHAGNIITEMISRGGILIWPRILPEILDLVSNVSGSITQAAQEGSMMALSKICEDNKELLDNDVYGQRPLDSIIPKLIEFTANPILNIRCVALTTLNFLFNKNQQLCWETLMFYSSIYFNWLEMLILISTNSCVVLLSN